MSTVQDLGACGEKGIRDFLDTFDTVLTDCDGVLWSIAAPIDNAVESIKKLHELGKKVFFVTNNSIVGVDYYCKKLERMGFPVTPDQIILPAKVICWYLKKIKFHGEAHVIGSPPFRQLLNDNGITMTDPNLSALIDDIPGTIKLLDDRPSVKAVICDFDANCNWMKMALAIRCLKRTDVLFLAGATDDRLPVGDGVTLLGPGPITAVISEQSGRKPIMCSKPSEVLRSYIAEESQVTDPARCLFIGDTIRYDMKFATLAGYKKLFVGTGVDTLADATEANDYRPDYYLDSLGSLSAILENLPCGRLVNGDGS